MRWGLPTGVENTPNVWNRVAKSARKIIQSTRCDWKKKVRSASPRRIVPKRLRHHTGENRRQVRDSYPGPREKTDNGNPRVRDPRTFLGSPRHSRMYPLLTDPSHPVVVHVAFRDMYLFLIRLTITGPRLMINSKNLRARRQGCEMSKSLPNKCS